MDIKFTLSNRMQQYIQEHYPDVAEITVGTVGIRIRLHNSHSWMNIFYKEIQSNN